MSGSAGSIFVDLLLRDANYVAGLNRSRQQTRSWSGGVQGDVNKASQAFTGVINPINNIGGAIARLSGVFAGALSTQKIIQYSDAWRGLESRLDLVTGSSEATARVQQELFDIAQANRQPLTETINAYTRLSNSLSDTQKAGTDLVGLTELLSKTLVISGTNAAGAATFFQQFGQAASSDFKAIGQELQTFADQNPYLYKILSEEARTYGKTLKQMGADGELSFDFISKAVSKNAEEINRNASGIALTVGGAFQQLDNAFLQFVGDSDSANAATSVLAGGINFLAQNLNLAVTAGLALSAVMLTRVTAGFLAANSQAALYQLTLARMAGVSGIAATATVGLSGALGTLRLAFLAIGGPIGIAVLGALGAMALQADYGAEAQERLNTEVGAFQNEAAKYIAASEEMRRKIQKDTQDRIASYQNELKAVQALFEAYNQQGFAGKFFDNLDSAARRQFGIGGGQGVRDIVAEGAALEKAISELESLKQTYNSVGGGSPVAQAETTSKEQSKLDQAFKRNREIITGLNSSTLEYQDTLKDLNALLKAGQIDQDTYSAALIRAQEELNKTSESATFLGMDLKEFGKEASRNLQDVFKDFFLSADEGFDGIKSSFANMLKEMVANAAAANLASVLFGSDKKGQSKDGLLGGLLGNLGGLFGGGSGLSDGAINLASKGGIFQFANGGFLGPGEFGIAGEAGAELVYGGRQGATIFNQDQIANASGGGGNTYQIDARGTDASVVRRLEVALMALAGPGVVEQRVLNARSRGTI